MNAGNSLTKEKIIFYLNLDKASLPKWFYGLAVHLNSHGVKLVPIERSQISSFQKKSGTINLLILVTSFKHKRIFEQMISDSLGLMIKNGQTKCFHLTSFGENTELKKRKVTKNYFYYKLPFSMKKIAEKLALEIDNDKESQLWPGGRGPRLSDEIIG